jgi:hypothetical protein
MLVRGQTVLCATEVGVSLHPGVARGGLVDIGLVDNEEDLNQLSARVGICHLPKASAKTCDPSTDCALGTHVLRSAERDACDAVNVLQSELGNGLASLLLVARVHSDRGARGDVGLALLALGLVAGLVLLNLDVLLLGLIRKLFNAWVGHFDGCG